MITIPMTVAASQVEIPMGVSAQNAGVSMSLGAEYSMTTIEVDFPPGGNTGDLLAKKTDADYDVEWITPPEIPDPHEIIDDTAGAGDTDKVLSADKSYSLLNGKEDKGHSVPAGGFTGDLLAKSSNGDYAMQWITPATSVEQDNTRPITAAAVYTEVGNINALLATI